MIANDTSEDQSGNLASYAESTWPIESHYHAHIIRKERCHVYIVAIAQY
jgi:hypothetical protein